MRGFNLSKFKKAKEDKDWATLIHEDGHTLNIAKAPLSPLQRKQLESLQTHKFAKGGVAHYDDGTGNAQASNESDSGSDNSDQTSYAPLEIEAIPDSSTPSQAPAGAQLIPAQKTPSQDQSLQAPGIGQSQIKGLQDEQTAEIEKADALQDQADAESKAYGQTFAKNGQLANLQNALSPLTQSQVIKDLQTKDDNLFKAYQNQKIDPDRFWTGYKDAEGKQVPGHSKIAAGIGVLLSGIGQIFGQGKIQENGALQMLHNEINKDIDLQKNDQSKNLNLWKMNREALGSAVGANLATQNQLYTGLKYKLAQAAANAQGPIARANADKAIAQIDQQIGMNNFKLSLLNPTSDNPDPANRVQFLVPPDKQKEVADKIDAAKNTVANAPGILEAFDQAAKEARPLTGGLGTSPSAVNPWVKTAGQQALQARLGPTFNDIEHTVRKAAMDNMDHNVTPAFGDSDYKIATKRQSLINYLRSKSSATLPKQYGIDLEKFPSTRTSAIGMQQQPQIKIVNGVKYMRGPNGQAIAVK